MTACPRSLLLSQAQSGTARASSASGIKRTDRRWRLGHEGFLRQIGSLRDLSNLALNHGRRERKFWMHGYTEAFGTSQAIADIATIEKLTPARPVAISLYRIE